MATNSIIQNINDMVSEFTCGYCFAQSGYDNVFSDHAEIWHTYGDLLVGKAIAVLRCRKCKMHNIFIFSVTESDYGDSMPESDMGPYLAERPQIISCGYDEELGMITLIMWIECMGQYPYGHKLPESVPENIRLDLQEAGNCLAIEASNAAVIMCRRVVERLAAHFGVTPKKNRMLGQTLQELEKKELISNDLLTAFREIKDWGNIGTHPGESEQGIQFSESRKVVELTFLLIEHVFPRVRHALKAGRA